MTSAMRNWGKIVFAGFAAAGCAAASACTSWIIHRTCSGSGMMMVQKSRDSYPGHLSADVQKSNGVRWIRVGTKSPYPTSAVSEKGIAVINNDGDDVSLKHPGGGHLRVPNGLMMRKIMADCSTAWEGAMLLLDCGRTALREGRGGTFLIADPKRAFLVDIAPGYAEVKELTGGIVVITNTLHLPGIEEFSRKTAGSVMSDRAREANVRAALKKAQVNGKYTPRGTVAVSRMTCGNAPATRYPYRYWPDKKVSSLGGSCFELDPEFPAYLTTAYITMGPQQHTICLPTPMALRQTGEKIRSGEWAKQVFKFRKKVGNDHKYLKDFVEFEDRIFPEYEQTREAARKLLREGKKAEATELLNACYERHYKAAEELVDKIYRDAGIATEE